MMIEKTLRRNRILISLIIGTILLVAIPTPLADMSTIISDVDPYTLEMPDRSTMSSASSSGDSLDSLLYYSREVQGLDFSLMNDYSDTASHLTTVDLSSYHIAGWSLYEAELSVSRIVALSEHEVVASSSSPSSSEFMIHEHSADVYYDQLAQGFYNMSHFGKLENISLLYGSNFYDPSTQNYAYIDIRSDYQDGSTKMVSSVQLENVGLTPTWANVTESVILSADTVYYAVLNGSLLVEVSNYYPYIWWYYVDDPGTYLTRRHNTDGDTWGTSDRPYEALLNYTYIPWNTSSNSALEFSNTQSIALQGNSTSLSGLEWLFSSTSNLTQVQFSSNQSVSVEYDLTLRYQQSISSTTTWYAGSSGSSVAWNITSAADFPELSGTLDKNLSLTIPSDWVAIHLFNATTPTQYYDYFTQNGQSVVYTSLGDETWILECSSPNYLQSISKYDTSDDSAITDKVSVAVTMDINSTIESPSAEPVTNGKATLKVHYQAAIEYTENFSVSTGKSYHQWDISTHSSSNGLHTIDIFWANGTEVGYRTSDVLVYYETTLVVDNYDIEAYTDNTFYIGVDYNQVFPVSGIDSGDADVTYSFGAVVNQSLTDQSNGRWDATVSTASMIPGSYDLYVYAEGYALENRSLTIQVTLTHDTEVLAFAWSNANDITYIETTELSVYYNRVTGSIPISGATVNVTIDSDTWFLKWDGVSAYKITFNGTDVPPSFGVHSLTIQAWKDGHKAQSDSTQTLTIQEEPTTMTYEWTNTNSITYVESTTLRVNYTISDGSALVSANVNVTIGSDTFTLVWNSGTETYDYTFDGDSSPGIGIYSLTIEADKHGHVYKSVSSVPFTITEEPTTLTLTFSDGFDITFIEETYLIAYYNQSDGTPVLGATINATIGTDVWTLTYYAPIQGYRVLFKGSDVPPGFGSHPVSVQADLFGYFSQSESSKTLILQEDPTTLLLSWSDGDSITYIEQTTLLASYTMSNSSVVRNAIVNVTIGADTWLMTWHEASQTYRKTFYGTDVPPSFGVHSLTVEADKFGFVARSDSSETLTITEVPTNYALTWSNGFDITYIQETYLTINYTMTDGSPVLSATVNVTINGQVFDLTWYAPTQIYRLLIRGLDNPPGLGVFPITVKADRHGYVSHTDSSKTLTLQEDPTTLLLSWSDGNNITYIEQTIFSASYTMSNGSAVRGALLNVTIGLDTWTLLWHEGSQTYRKTFLGSDNPPGFGTHSLTVEADLYGFVSRSNSAEQLILTEEPTTLSVSWSSGSSITYVEETMISVSYRMSDTTFISGATVTVTIGVDVWTLMWNPVSDLYETTFHGVDNPPGLGVHSLSIDASKFGFESQNDSTESLTIGVELTSLQLSWWVSNTVSYVDQTVLYANYTMSNGSAVLGAYVTIAIGSANYTFEWNAISEVYFVILKGDDSAYSLGIHSVNVQATLFGYQRQTDSSQTLAVLEESTIVIPSWSPDDNITYFEATKLSVRYEMSNGTAIPGAIVNITINTDVWVLVWNPVSEAYETTIRGSDYPPGYGTHIVEIRAWKYGYESVLDSSQQLTIRLEDTNISFDWQPSATITYVGETKIRVYYLLRNGTPIQGATVNITRGSTRWDAVWNSTSQAYEWIWLGTDDPPGIGSHLLVIRAWKLNYVGITDITQTLTINEEPTLIQASWSNGNNITYVQSTRILVNFTDSSGVVIPSALVDITIGTDNWVLSWNATSQLYEKTFTGSDSPPGLGTHSISIRGWESGYETTIDNSQTITLRIEPTTLTPSWLPSDSITFVESTTLSVRYEMSSGDPIAGATLNATIGPDVWILTWNPISEVYETTFRGDDSPPGLGAHPLVIQASRFGFQSASDSSETLRITEESTSFVITWLDGDNITYVFGTTLSVRYQMSNSSPIPAAVVNATIDGITWTLTWNLVSESYERYFAGSEDPPGYGTHTVEIRASKFGYQSLLDSTQKLTIRLEDTSVSFEWDLSGTITYVEGNKIRIFYKMSNGTSIIGATVNITIETDLWIASWNMTSEAYEVSFLGTDSPPGIGLHVLVVRAWKMNYVGLTNSSQILTINEEPTQVQVSWTNGNSITYVETTRLRVNYTTNNGTIIPAATVNVTAGVETWNLIWNGTSQLYELTFSNGSASWPGLGTHGFTIRAWKFGYEMTVDITQTLTINSEQVDISSTLLGGGTITYVESTILQVNYTTSDGYPILGATVNVTVAGTLWDLVWHAASGTYRIQFNGSDADPGFGTHQLIVNVSAHGFDALTDSSQFLTIQEEPTTLSAYWGAPNFNSVTYFEYTILYVEFQMSNGSDILGASVNVTIDATTWTLSWNSTAGAYNLRFDGSDSPPGLGTHSLIIEAALYGYEDGTNSSQSLTLAKDPTTIEVSWTNGNDITFVEYTVLSVVYRMSNGTVIQGATVNTTIGVDLWVLTWNGTAGAYQIRFNGDQNPQGLGIFVVDIQASAKNFVPQSPSTSLTIRSEGTTATASWSSTTIDWTETVVLSFDYRDSYGSLINDASTKLVYVNGTEYTLMGTNGTYWIEFDNTFDLGLHSVWANFTKYGYDSATAVSISFTITEAQTDLVLVWSSTVIDYLGQIDLAVDYYYVGDSSSIPPSGVVANITIDGSTYDLNPQNGFWITNLTGVFLNLGSHTVDIRAQVYGYEYSETLGIMLTVNEVTTDILVVSWVPSNLTIEYTDNLSLTVDYTFSGVDVPATATINVSIESLVYDLTYSAGIWSVTIQGSDLGIGVRIATISAWLYGYQAQVIVTVGINVTEAANTFKPTWEPLNLQATYIDTVNLSVIYTEDFTPIIGATVELSINGTIYSLTYSSADERWHFNMKASDIGLGIWNVTVTANKTGYADGWESKLLTISLAQSNLTVDSSATTIFYDESIVLNIYYQIINTSVVPSGTCVVTVDSVVQSTTWITDHWTVTLEGSVMGLGIHSVSVDVDSFGYEPKTDSFTVTVNPISTIVIVDSTAYQMYPFDSVTVSFTWWDDKNSLGLAGSSPGVIWPDTFSIVNHGNGTYSITVNNDALHVGLYQLNVTFSRLGYTLGEMTVQIEIVELPIVVTFTDEVQEFENETITVSMQIFDGPHATIVDWAEMVIELEGIEYQLIYDSETQRYSVDIWLASLSPGFYTLNFTASATECETETGEIQLEILPKILYTIVIDVEEQIQAGQTAQITIQVSYESGSISGFEVEIHIIVERGEAAPQEILETASDTYEFLVPIDATGLTVWAEFEGSEGEWPAISNTVNREVTPGGVDILSFIISLFEDPVILTIIVGGGGSAAGLILLRRRRRSGITSVTEPIVALTTATPAPAGEMDILQDKIKNSADGLTRAQIAQSLEISTNKAGALIKKLLESNPTFEEVREGRMRRIRFKG
ncbi:MAG: hypothetical protein ACFFCX_12500 [Candidatus Sifarchaeia archaeon]